MTTTNAGDAIIAAIVWGFGNGAGSSWTATSVSGISSTNTTGWTKRKSINNGGAGTSTDRTTFAELWYGFASAALTAESITATMTGGNNQVDSGIISVWGVHDAIAYTGNPFDPHIGLTATEISQGSGDASPGPNAAASISGLNTTGTTDLALAFWCSIIAPGNDQGIPTGWTALDTGSNAGGTFWANFVSGTLGLSSAWSSQTVTATTPNGISEEWIYVVDAFQNAPGGGGGAPINLTAGEIPGLAMGAALNIINPVKISASMLVGVNPRQKITAGYDANGRYFSWRQDEVEVSLQNR